MTTLRFAASGLGLLAVLSGSLGAQAVPQGASTPLPPDYLVARESVHPTGFPRILILDAPGSPLVTFRLSVPIEPSVDAATAAPILQSMAHARIIGIATTLGAQIEAGSSAHGISYTVTGALADLDQLTFILRQATQAPQASQGFAAARGALEMQLARIGETGEGQVETQLRARATPGDPSVSDVRERLRRLSFYELEAFWRASHDPQTMTLVVVGDVSTPSLLAALSGLGADTGTEPPREPLLPSPPNRDRPDLLRRWMGFAWATRPTLDPRSVVAASLAARHLREQRDGYEAYVRLWEGRDSDVLAVVGSAYGRNATALRRRLSALPGDVAGALDDTEVRAVIDQLHWSLLAQARTPWGRANLVGRFLDAGDTPDAARRYLDALLALTPDDVRAFLATISASTPTTVEVGS
jgi:predicted Zn-dependent peptidase